METIEAVAASSVSILVPYLVEAGKAVAKKAGEATWAKVESIYDTIRRKFQGDPISEEALNDLVTNPMNEDNQAVLRKTLRKAMEADKDFLSELTKLVTDARPGGIVVSGSGAVATSHGVGAGAGGIAVGGNVEGGIHMGNSEHDKKG
jgi:hypothetical protein